MMDNRTLEIVEHIKYALKGWFDEYPGLEIVYYYDPGTDYHIVIYDGPEEVCGHDGDLIIEEGELYESLFDAYGYDVNVIIYYRKCFPYETDDERHKDCEALLYMK